MFVQEPEKKFDRRLTDKLKLAVKQAIAQGRENIGENLLLCLQALEEQDHNYSDDRRMRADDRRSGRRGTGLR